VGGPNGCIGRTASHAFCAKKAVKIWTRSVYHKGKWVSTKGVSPCEKKNARRASVDGGIGLELGFIGIYPSTDFSFEYRYAIILSLLFYSAQAQPQGTPFDYLGYIIY
jgi:hypothetical protein